MADNKAFPSNDLHRVKEAVCVDTNRVYDSCADKDCLADMRVYLTDRGQAILDRAISVRCRSAEVLNCAIEVERVPFNRGYYAVNLTFFIKVVLDALTSPSGTPTMFEGLAVFDKKCILYGSEGNVKIFSSNYVPDGFDDPNCIGSTNPTAKVQCVDPIALDAQICRVCDCCNTVGDDCGAVPVNVRRCFEGEFGSNCCEKAVKVTLGMFTIVQLERDVQMLMPAYDFCVPTKECTCDTETPCDAFKRICFPVDEFFPPNRQQLECGSNTPQPGASCGCN